MDSTRRRVIFSSITIVMLCVTETIGQGESNPGNPNQPGNPAIMTQKLKQPTLSNPNTRNVKLLQQSNAMLSGQQRPGNVPKMQKAKPNVKSAFRLSETKECADDIIKHCNSRIYKNNFAILDCLQNNLQVMEDISVKCQHTIWKYKRNLTSDDRFDYAAKEVCKNEMHQSDGDFILWGGETPECSKLEIGKGLVIPCLVDYIENITGSCRTYLEKMARIVFSDYRLIYHFVDKCQSDISKFKCGRIGPQDPNEDIHSQGKTVECLAKKIGDLDHMCRKQVLRIAELQSDDFHLDRELYYACRDDRETFCENIPSGQGKVYECLFKHKFDSSMTKDCRDKLTVRQQLIAEDVKVEKTFYTACRNNIKELDCSKKKSSSGDFRRASILLCLENALKKDEVIVPECLQEMNQLRQSLMEDYSISPEIVSNCEPEIVACGGGLERNGKTIHCLMDMARPSRDRLRDKNDKMNPKCLRAVEDLLDEADPASDYRMDKVLKMACQAVVDTACRDIQPGDARVISCLMDKVDTEHMTDDCEEKLMEIQYFVARDFRLDPVLYKNCHKDAQNLCSAPKDWADQKSSSPSLGPLVLPCLYGLMKRDEPGSQVSRGCKHEILRVMRQRAKRVELEPEIERACVQDLGTYCSGTDTYKRNQEIMCLQDNYDHLNLECQKVIGNYTEDEDQVLELDNILMKACTPMIDKFCDEEMDDDADADEIMECLIENKHHPDMNDKCKAGVEHHQLISLKDFRFNHKFKEACKKSVMKLCRNKKTKFDVISCLSEHVRNDTLKEQKHRVDKPCRKQLRIEVLERGEDIKLDPNLRSSCEKDIRDICGHIEHGNAKVIECLKNHQKKLSKKCHKMLFKREKEEVVLGDYKVHTACKKMIKKHCKMDGEENIIECLRHHKDDPDFDDKCRSVIIKREIAQNTDYRLNPALMKKCRMDIPKFCKEVTRTQKNDDDLEGKVVTCLRKQFAVKRLSRECNEIIGEIIKDSALNYMEDPVLAQACENVIIEFCGDEHENAMKVKTGSRNKVEMVQSDGNGAVVECLKTSFKNRMITDTKCKQEVARIIQEAQIDINVDPLLHLSCKQDLYRFCGDIEAGEGRKMACLMAEFEDHPKNLSPDCHKLFKKRKDLWELAAEHKPIEGFQEMYDQISASPAKVYILGILCTVIGLIFIVGITCGRVSKRMAKENKMK